MRVPGWLFLTGVLALVGLTALCSVVSFVGTQRLVVDLGHSGVQVDSPVVLVQALTNRNGLLSTPSCDINCIIASRPAPTRTPLPAATATPLPGVTALPTVPGPTPTLDPMAGIQQWQDPRRFNLLLLGIDQRTGVADEEKYFRTDTMMIVSIDPVRKTAGVLSIPRDLWVSIPGFTEGRINTANALGDSSALPGGGPGLAAATIEQNLGIDIDKYVLINFDVFTSVVNIISPDGTQICVRETIDDENYPDAGYGFIHVHFDPGCQRLDAEHLLQYARTRHTQGGDFDRARRQQEVMRALQEEVLSAGGIANFISQIPQLWTQLTGSYKTDMSLEEILSLAQLAQDIDKESIHFNVIDNMAVQFATTSSGDQVLIPNYSAIRLLIQDTFDPQPALGIADLRERAQQEGANIVIYNNTDTQGLAGQTREWLIGQGISVSNVGNMPEPTNVDTEIRAYQDKPWTARYLAALFGLPQERITRGSDGLTSADIMIVVGPDIQPLLTGEPE
jgi:polyisoprenyl-teichoic acid--peptidoglycan teichoic acid transferase